MKNPSKRQQVIADTWLNKTVNILIRAVAGSGKTSTIVWLTKLLSNKKYLILAFNTDIVEEVKPKVGSNTDVFTMHSFALKLLKYKYKSVLVKPKIHQQKIIKYVRNYCENIELPNAVMWSTIYYLIEMLDVMRIHLIDYKDISAIQKIANTKIYGDPPSIKDEILEEMWFHICKEYYKAIKYDSLWCDFTDMIYIPVYNSYEIKKIPYDYICIDEAQDLSSLQHEFFNLLIPAVEKWISVGDSSQSIYEFIGANSKSFELFLDKKNVIELPLDINYRSSSNIIEDANRTLDLMNAPLMVPFKTTKGSVTTTEDKAILLTLDPENTMVICRNSSPLFDVYFYLLDKGTNVTFRGKDIYTSLNKFLQPYKFLRPYQAYNKIDNDLHNMIIKSNKTEQESINLFMFKENVKIFALLYAKLGHKFGKVSDLLDYMYKLLNNKNGEGILLSTIHKSKGLEAENIVILNENLIPSKYATTPEELKQEENLRFVAKSRAMENTIYLNLELETE